MENEQDPILEQASPDGPDSASSPVSPLGDSKDEEEDNHNKDNENNCGEENESSHDEENESNQEENISNRDEMESNHDEMESNHDELESNHDELESNRDEIESNHDELESNRDEMDSTHDENESNHDDEGDSINDEGGSNHGDFGVPDKDLNSDETNLNGNCKVFEFQKNTAERKSLEASLEGELDFEDEVHQKDDLSKEGFSNECQASNEQQERDSDEGGFKIGICAMCTRSDGSSMIMCDECDNWYHWECANIVVPPKEEENWYCERCTTKRQTSSDCADKEEGVDDNEVRKENDENSEAQSMEEGEDDGELSDQDEQDDDLEEGEVKDTTPTSKTPTRQICRFFNRGQCTWGNSCRFLHLSANDKGNYCMFSPTRVPPPPFGLGPPPGIGMGPHMGQRVGPRNGPDFLPPPPMPPPPPPPPPSTEPTPAESAWERGLRHAKELMKKASRRKEQEPDFEEKRLNLSIDENDRISAEYDKENEFFGKSPYRRQTDVFRYEEANEVFDNGDREAREHWRGGRYENFEIRWTRQDGQNKDRRDKEKPRNTRLSAERDKPNKNFRGKERWRDDRLSEIQTTRTRGDEWRDPWRRSKTPKGRRSRSRGRSRGSYSSVSSRSYSDRSSRSSYSYSRSSSRSSCYSSASGSPKRPPQRKLPYTRKIASPPPKATSRPLPYKRRQPPTSRKVASPPPKVPSRPLPYKRKPPPSRSRSGSYSGSHSSHSASHSRSSSSRSRSASKSPSPSRSRSYSRSLSMSSVSSASSSISHSSSGSEVPPPRQPEVRAPPSRVPPPRALVPKKDVKPPSIPKPLPVKSAAPSLFNEMERLMQYDKLRDSNKTAAAAVAVKVSGNAITPPTRDKKTAEESLRSDLYSASNVEKLKDPAKQKQQIKLTLLNKAASLSKREVDLSKVKIEKDDTTVRGASKVSSSGMKRSLSPTSSSSKMSSVPAPKRSTSSRRDELLKQLKAVEDAIARKRAKFS